MPKPTEFTNGIALAATDVDGSIPGTIFTGAGAPSNGTSGTGATVAGPGSIYIDTTGANAYINAGTGASPTWKLVTRAA